MTDFVIEFLGSDYSLEGFKYEFFQFKTDKNKFEVYGINRKTAQRHIVDAIYDCFEKQPIKIIRNQVW